MLISSHKHRIIMMYHLTDSCQIPKINVGDLRNFSTFFTFLCTHRVQVIVYVHVMHRVLFFKKKKKVKKSN